MRGSRSVVIFRCAPPGTDGLPRTEWGSGSSPLRVHDVAVPCAGRLQPEHFLKAFENGADLVLVSVCADGTCRYLEGDQRVRRRADYVRHLLDEIGLDGARVVVLTAADSINEAATSALARLPSNPLGNGAGERSR